MDKIALVTGAARGIGRAIAAQLAREGYAVCINYLTNRGDAESLVAMLRAEGCHVIAVQADVAEGKAVLAMVRTVESVFGPVTLLVNNAGISRQELFQDVDDKQWDRALSVNLGGARHAVQAVLPHMILEKSGCIVNISSIWGASGCLLRGHLRLHKSRPRGADPITGTGTGAISYSGQRCGAGLH